MTDYHVKDGHGFCSQLTEILSDHAAPGSDNPVLILKRIIVEKEEAQRYVVDWQKTAREGKNKILELEIQLSLAVQEAVEWAQAASDGLLTDPDGARQIILRNIEKKRNGGTIEGSTLRAG